MPARTPVLQEIARALGESASLREAAHAFAEGAVEALRASGGYVEYRLARDDLAPGDGAGQDERADVVEVLASVGDQVPAAGQRSPSVAAPEGNGAPSIVVPLLAGTQVLGALGLRRLPGDSAFTAAEAELAHTLGDLAAAALRRIELVEALRESEERFRQIAENIREFIWLSDPEFTRHYYINAAYERIWGRSLASLYADPRSLLEGVHPHDRQRVTAALSGMVGGGYDVEYRVMRPDGEVRHVSSRGVAVRNDRGEVWRIAGITEDVTQRKEAELERDRLFERERAAREASEYARAVAEQRQRELERVSTSRTRLIRGFTHDVKNPLGAADGFLALLAEGVRGELSALQKEGIERARRSIRSALDLINHSLELARAESGQLDIVRVPTDPRALAAEVAEEFRAQAEGKRLSLDFQPSPAIPSIRSDPARVRQVLANLVSNAVKYTPDGGRITVRVERRAPRTLADQREQVVIDVADTGTGISPEQQTTLFQEFTRFDAGAAHGSGIGLAISQHVARALGGIITVESEVGAGSVFSFWLPIEH